MAETFLAKARAAGVPACSIIVEQAPLDAAVHQKIRRMHCSHAKGNPDCVGRITIDAGGVTLQCVRCGDVRGKNPKEMPDV